MMSRPLTRLTAVEPTIPLNGHRAFQSQDLASFRSYLSHSYCDHHIRQKHPGIPIDACHNRVALSAMSLNYLRYGADVEIDIGTFDNFYMLEFPQAGSTVLHLGQNIIESQLGSGALISPTLPVCSQWSRDCEQLMVKIARTAMEAHLSTLLGRALPHELVFDPVLDFETPEGESLLRFCWFLFDQYGDGTSALFNRGISKDLEHAFMSALLMAQSSNYSDMLSARSAAVAPRHVRRALDYIDANLQNEMCFDALVETAGVSARALYSGFNRFVGMPPQMLVRNKRLDRVRDDLAAAGAGITVSEIAMKWHFTHLGRFSSDYRKRFGESPRETLRR